MVFYGDLKFLFEQSNSNHEIIFLKPRNTILYDDDKVKIYDIVITTNTIFIYIKLDYEYIVL